MHLVVLTGTQRRQLIDTQQAFEAWRAADLERRRRYLGGMRWAERHGTEYLLRKNGIRETSLGPRSAETEAAHDAFVRGRADNKGRLRGLAARLDEYAPINRAMGLGRVPVVAARVLRRCDVAGLLGEQVLVVGTNAIFAYEALAGVFAASGVIATNDIDLLYDARRRLSLAVKEVRETVLIGLLRQADKSFMSLHPRGFRAANRDGYLVDLIRPEARDPSRDRRPRAMTDLPDDLEGAAIFGLDWLVNAPKVEATVLDERGYPVRIVAIDPRAFALHKAWLAKRADREPLKVQRDLEQAKVAAAIARTYLGLSFDEGSLTALPLALRQLLPDIASTDHAEADGATEPHW